MARIIGTAGTAPAAPRRRRPPVQSNPDQRPRAPARLGAPVPARPSPITASPFQRPFTPQRTQATGKVRAARRNLPPLVLAEPPIVGTPTGAPGGKTRPMTRGELNAFLNDQSRIGQHARNQIVASIRRTVAGSSGAERVQRVGQVMDEIGHDPRLARTRAAIRYYTAVQRATSRPQTVAQLKAGPGPSTAKVPIGVGPLRLATVNLAPTGRAIEGLIAGATPGLRGSTPEQQFVKHLPGNALKDVGTIGTGVFTGAYGAGSAIVGDLGDEIKAIAAGNPQTSGFGSRSSKLVEAMAKGIAQEARHPVRSFEQHPLLTTLDAAALVSGFGRVGGAVARGAGAKDAAGLRGRLDAASHTVRSPISMTNDPASPQIVERTHSKDLTRRVAAAGRDRNREPLRDAQGNVVMHTDRGRIVPVLRSTPREQTRHLNREADFRARRTVDVSRDERTAGIKATRVRGVRGRPARDITALVVQGAITHPDHFAADLRVYRDMIAKSIADHESGDRLFRDSGDLKTAQRNLATADRVLHSPKALALGPKIAAEGIRIGGDLHARDVANADAELFDSPEAMRRAGLIVPAVTHMGAEHFTVAEHQALERDALKAEQAAQATYDAAKTPAERKAAQAAVDAAREHRIAVSGRPTELTRAHEDAKTKLADAQRAEDHASAEHARLEKQAQRLAAQHAVTRQQEVAQTGPVAVYHVGDRRFTTRAEAAAHLQSESLKHALALVERDAGPLRGGTANVDAELERLTREQAKRPVGEPGPESDLDRIKRRYRESRAALAAEPAAILHDYRTALESGDKKAIAYAEKRVRGWERKRGSGMRAAAKTARDNAAAVLRRIDARLARLEKDYHNAEQISGLHSAEQIRADIEALNSERVQIAADVNRLQKVYEREGGSPPLRIERVATSAAEAKRVGELSNARRGTDSALKRRQAATKARRQAEHGVRENPLPKTQAGVRYGEGNPAGKPVGSHLPTKDIEDFLRSRGRDPETVAYLPHRADLRGKRAYYTQFRPGGRPVLDTGESRTGEAFRRGVTEMSTQLIRDQGVRQRIQLVKAQQIDNLVAERGTRHPAWVKSRAGAALTPAEKRVVAAGGMYTPGEALEISKRLENDSHEQPMTPMVAHSGRLDAGTRRVIRENLQGPGAMDSLGQRLLNNRIVTPENIGELDKRTRNVVLVPSDLVNRLNAHLRPAGSIEKLAQWLNTPFRYAVLPTFHWLTANFVEPWLVRLGTKGSGLVNIPGAWIDWRAAGKKIKQLENGTPEERRAAQEIKATQLGGGLFVGGASASVRREISEFMTGPGRRAYGRIVAELPVVHQMAQMVGTAVHWLLAPLRTFFQANRHVIENPALRVAFGHQFRADMQAFTGSWWKTIRLADEAVKEAGAGLVNTPTQHRYMKASDTLLGKYAGFSPTMRRLVQTIFPFIPWTLNAARFIYVTMPFSNTVKTAVLLKVQQVMAKDWQQIHQNLPPGNLQFAIPNGKGGWINIARDTPYGLTTDVSGGDVTSILNQFLPQLSGAQAAFRGKDPFGRDLQLSTGPLSALSGWKKFEAEAKIAAESLAEAGLPYAATLRRLREHGQTAYADSTVISPKTKPGTSHGMSAIRRTLDPFRPTYLTSGGGGGSGTDVGPPLTRMQQLQQRRAAILRGGGTSSRMQDLQRRRAAILRGG